MELYQLLHRGMWYQRLLEWFRVHGRLFPWRITRDWYRVVVAEFMLIRTRSEVVDRVYREFIDRFPRPEDLCNASDEEIKCFFKKIGLIYRASRLKEVVCRVLRDYRGVFPCSEKDLDALPGIGRYLRNVLMTRICGVPRPFVDTNILRFLSRFLGHRVDVDYAEQWLLKEVPVQLLEDVNIALLDLAAMICKPRKPLCGECPLRSWCRSSGSV